MRTILTIREQKKVVPSHEYIMHKWSTRGYGSSRIVDHTGATVARAGGCGYDRWGAALGNYIKHRFPFALDALARKTAKGRAGLGGYVPCPQFYGLSYNRQTGRAGIDGATGSSCMLKILEAIGFRLLYCGETQSTHSGTVHYCLVPLGKGRV